MELDTTVHGVTELRVHGVSGTPPEETLDMPAALVRRVDGDSRAGFWRRWYPGGSTHDEPDRRHLEAYAWGGLTSGPASRALFFVGTRGAPADEDEWWPSQLDREPDDIAPVAGMRWHCRDSYVLAPPSRYGTGQDVRWVRPPVRALPDALRLLEYLVDACEEEG